MELILNSKIIESEKKDKIKNVIILLHGYGGDGADISSIAFTWRECLYLIVGLRLHVLEFLLLTLLIIFILILNKVF